MKEFLPGINSETNARAEGIDYYYKDRPTYFKEMPLYFYVVKRTREPPYCFECMIALVKSRRISKQEIRNSTSGLERAFVLLFLPADYMHTEAFLFTSHFRSLSFINISWLIYCIKKP